MRLHKVASSWFINVKEINFLCGRNWIFKPSNYKSLRVDLRSKRQQRQQQFSIPRSTTEGIHKHSGRCQSSERSSASAIELLSGKQQPLARLSFVTRLVRVTSIMASLARSHSARVIKTIINHWWRGALASSEILKTGNYGGPVYLLSCANMGCQEGAYSRLT
jgi:hypothetical protein